MTEGPRVNLVMREIYTWILCLSYPNEKQTSRIQSLYLYFIKNVPIWLRNIRFLIHNRAVFRTAAGTAGWYKFMCTGSVTKFGLSNWSIRIFNFYVPSNHTFEDRIFTLPVFSAAMNIRKNLTSIFPWSCSRDVWTQFHTNS